MSASGIGRDTLDVTRDPVPSYPDLATLLAELGAHAYAHPEYEPGNGRIDGRKTVARVVIDAHWCVIHADCRVDRLRDLADHLGRGGAIHRVPTKTLIGISDQPGPGKDGLFVYLEEKHAGAATASTATARFQCPSCFKSRPTNQRTPAGICVDCTP